MRFEYRTSFFSIHNILWNYEIYVNTLKKLLYFHNFFDKITSYDDTIILHMEGDFYERQAYEKQKYENCIIMRCDGNHWCFNWYAY